MKYNVVACILLFLTPHVSVAQTAIADSLRLRLEAAQDDSTEVNALNEIAWELRHTDPVQSRVYAWKAMDLARESGYSRGLAWAYRNNAVLHFISGEYAEALSGYLESLSLFERLGDRNGIASSYTNIGLVHWQLKNYEDALRYFFDALKQQPNAGKTANAYGNIGLILTEQGKYTEALAYTLKALELHQELGDRLGVSVRYNNIGWIYERQNDLDMALMYYERSLAIREELQDTRRIASVCTSLGSVLRGKGEYQKALTYFFRAQSLNQQIGDRKQMEEVYEDIARTYAAMGDFRSAYQHHVLFAAMKDSVLNEAKAMDIARVEADYEVQQKQREIKFLKRANQLQQNLTYATTGGLLLFLLFSVIIFIAYRSKTKINRKLQATQQQLVVQEKLASLGQLTAGIAHEIQNPLNFVNNFADLTAELAREARTAFSGTRVDGQEEPAELDELLVDIEENAAKVCTHGERASSIVRDMVAHAQPGSGEKQFTDVNALLTETISIAYQGKYAHSSGLDVRIKRDFTPGLPSVQVYVPDLRRVFINILNNAFDALDDKRKAAGDQFSPVVTVTTSARKNGVAISIRDNGSGIPADVRSKIFQPFFTTKDPGRGTGLGLHMSYDIVTVKHGGELLLDSETGVYTEFTIVLPIA